MIPGVAAGTKVYLNGAIVPVEDAHISVLDRGFIFGDGIYDVVPVYGGKPFRMDEHLSRLLRCLAAIRIASPLDKAGWAALVQRLIAVGPKPDCSVYLQVTRGAAKRDHAFPTVPVAPTVFGIANPLVRPSTAMRTDGISAVSIEDQRWLHCDIKSISMLGNVLAKQQAVDAGVREVVQFRDGTLTEGASCNVWVVKDGHLYAPPRNHLILEGIRYGLLAELAEEAGIPFAARPLSRADVKSADELLMTSAGLEVVPLTTLDGVPVGTGRPGPVYAKLRAGYDARIAAL